MLVREPDWDPVTGRAASLETYETYEAAQPVFEHMTFTMPPDLLRLDPPQTRTISDDITRCETRYPARRCSCGRFNIRWVPKRQ